MEVELSSQQAHLFALSIVDDIKKYIEENSKEYLLFLKEKGYIDKLTS